jgi:hypothetical protein
VRCTSAPPVLACVWCIDCARSSAECGRRHGAACWCRVRLERARRGSRVHPCAAHMACFLACLFRTLTRPCLFCACFAFAPALAVSVRPAVFVVLPCLLAQSERLSFGPIGGLVSSLSDLTSLKPRRNHARSEVRLNDLMKIRGMSECLGKGVSGTVWKVRDRSVDETLALKEMAMDTADEGKCQVPSRRRPAALAPHPR